jgi:hypothetical protein
MSRVLALIGAVCLIAAAILARAVLTDDDDDGGDSGDGDGGAELVVACIPELADACEEIDRDMDLSIEDPAVTIERLAAGEEIDAWVTLDPWPEMARFTVRDGQLDVVEPVAEQELATVVRSGFADECDAPPTWSCLQDANGRQAVLQPPDSALGALATGAATADVFEAVTGTRQFAAQDIVAGGVADAYLQDYEFGRDPLAEMLQLGPAGPKATIALAAVATARIEGSREDGNLVVEQVRSEARVAVVVAGPRADRVAGEPGFTDTLVSLGWRLAADAATTGLPNAGVLVALQGAVG